MRVLALCLLSFALHADAPPSDAPVAAIPPPDATLVSGPASLSLGAEALLALPEGWRFVPADQLKAYWRAAGKQPGAWDRGVLLPQDGWELRLIFEPMGGVALERSLDANALLAEAQGVALSQGKELAFWRWEPYITEAPPSLRFGGVWRQGADETVSMHLRWLGRRGVLKLDWRGTEDDANAFIAVTERLEEGLRFTPAEAYGAVPVAAAARMDLKGLVMDGLFGRAAALPGGEPPVTRPWWVWALVLGIAVLAAVAGAVALAKAVAGWLDRRAQAQKEAQRLAHLERSFGGQAEDVQELDEDEKG